MTLFKSGDLVVLKSGGPTMTIDTVNTDIFDDERVTGLLCVWFIGEIMQRVRFDPRAVRLVAAAERDMTHDGNGSGQGGLVPQGAAAAAAAATITTGPMVLSAPQIAPAKRPSKPEVPVALPEELPAVVAAKPAESAPEQPEIAAGPAPEPVPQLAPDVGDYAAVLDSMVGAMNALTADLKQTPAARPARRKRAAAGGGRASASGPKPTTH